jgi:ComF family protein
MFSNFVKNHLDGLKHVLFQSQCVICDTELALSESLCCDSCTSELHFTYFELTEEPTNLDKLFWGRVNVHKTYALIYYEKTNSSQHVIKRLKYKKTAGVGFQFGVTIGQKIKSLDWIKTIDALIPVPIHPKKEFIRGYNQSELLAEGISTVLNLPINKEFICRNENDNSQTKLGRFTRWDNVSGKFSLYKGKNYKHIALVDDVVTTGSTLETIIAIIQASYPTIQISVISLAVTK